MLKLFLFGPPRIDLNGAAVDFQRRKATALLIYLAVNNHSHSRDSAATLFYPNHTQQKARAYLRRDLAVLNTSLAGDWLIADRETVELKQSADLWVDTDRFHQLTVECQNHDHPLLAVCQACLPLLEEAAALYTDDFLAGFTLRDSAEFDDWQFFQAESLRQELASVLERLVQGLRDQASFEVAIPYARRWLALDPLHEPLHRVLMQLYTESGQQAAALRQYDECARLLEAEFGLPPEEETTTLFEAIKARRLVAPLLRAQEIKSDSPASSLFKASSEPAAASRAQMQALVQPPISAKSGRDRMADIGHEIPFIGREQEVAQLVTMLDQAGRGQGQTVLVEGESGIGKSRLVEEARRYAQTRGIRSLSGKCYEAEQTLPYQVVIHLVDQALAHWPLETFRRLSPTYLAEIARLVPDISHHFPDLPPPSDFQETHQSRLFRALAHFVTILADKSGLMLIVDDIQWADRITLQFLNHLVYHLEADPVLLVGIYRGEEAATDQELTALAQTWQHEAHVTHLRLSRLTRSDANALVEQVFHTSAQAEFLGQWLHQETGGNPFFLVSILQSLNERGLLTHAEDAGWRIETQQLSRNKPDLTLPDALRQSVHSRLRHLSKAAKSVIELAAVYGRDFDFPMLQAITQSDQSALLEILEDLVARQLWREVEFGRSYDFGHDKIREVVYHDLSHIRRVLLHQQVGHAAEKLTAGKRIGLLAEHFEKGEVWDKAVIYLSQAADRATKLFAINEATDFFDRAIAIVEADPDLVDAPTKFQLYEHRGRVRTLAGQLAGGIADFERVRQYARTVPDQSWERALLIELGHACRKADQLESAIQYLADALQVARRIEDEVAVADILFHLGTTSYSAGEYYQAAKYHQEAVDICDRLGNIDLVAVQAYHGRGEAYISTGNAAEGIKYYEKSLAMARQIGDKNYEAENLQMIGFSCLGYQGGIADYDRALAVFTESIAMSQKLGLEWLIWASVSGWTYALACRGDYAQAIEQIEQHIEQLEAIQVAPRYLSLAYDTYGDLLREINLLDQAEAAHARGLEIASEFRVHFWYPRLQANLAIDRLRRGNLSVEDELLAALTSTAKGGAVWHEVGCLEGLIELYLVLGTPRHALEYVDYLTAAAKSGGMRELMARAYRWRGEALMALEAYEAAKIALQQAVDRERAIGRPRLAWDIHDSLARLHQKQGNQAAADEHQRFANEIVATISANLKPGRWRQEL